MVRRLLGIPIREHQQIDQFLQLRLEAQLRLLRPLRSRRLLVVCAGKCNHQCGAAACKQHQQLFGWIYSIWTVATIVPSLSLTVRRLRDAGKHWAWMFIQLIPLVGLIWIIYLLVQPSVAG
jgi:uncharacterized membrane protein YhaH (DUF805 family)